MFVGPPMLQDNLQNFATCFKADGALRYSVFGGGAHRIINRRHLNCLRSGVRHVRNVEAKGHVADGTQHGNSLTQRPQICAAEPGPNYCPSVQMSKLVLYASPIELVNTVKFLLPKRDVTTLWLFHRGKVIWHGISPLHSCTWADIGHGRKKHELGMCPNYRLCQGNVAPHCLDGGNDPG